MTPKGQKVKGVPGISHAVHSEVTGAYLYDSDEYTPPFYWFDPDTGERRPNPYTDHQHWNDYLNHMTIRRFRRMLEVLPFETVHFERIGFSGKAFRVGRLLRGLSQIPLLDEFFIFSVFSVLKKPLAHCTG